jgi:hypothetical protein
MEGMIARPMPWLCAALLLCCCGDDGVPSLGSANDTSSSTEGTSTGAQVTGSSSGSADTTTTGPLDSSGSTGGSSGSSSAGPSTDSSSGSGSSSSGGELDPIGCSDGEREALIDESFYPDIAACSGAWSFPGVIVNTAMCERQGGDDGPIPTGRGCSVEDLCSAGWHMCESQVEVSDAGIASCDDEFWGGAFFATRQSGNGANTCGAIGLNDVFGCGDLGYTNIMSCSPLNRSTGNLCVELDDPPWSCVGADDMEADQLVKDGPEFGGVLCCRD